MKRCIHHAVLAACILAVGCTSSFGPQARHGITYYCPGAGNVDFGDVGVREGLEAAGYKGQIATVVWTLLMNPAIDQAVRVNARLAGARLADSIEEYLKRYPGRSVNLIGLSAGTGVVMWALEDLKPGVQVDNVVLLGSSLYYRYDAGKAVPHVKGSIYCYYSPHDAVLMGPMRVFGTIDGVFFEPGAGEVGLQSPHGADRIVNIPWRSEYQRYGYSGGHVDSTSPAFVRVEIAQRIMPKDEPPPEKGVAMRQDQDLLAGQPH